MYANVGATVQEDISEASVVLGVKQVPIDSLHPEKTFCFFSHTIKVRDGHFFFHSKITANSSNFFHYQLLLSKMLI